MAKSLRLIPANVKAGLILMLMLICFLATYYYHFGRHDDVVFSHIFYLPIALAGAWWGKRAFYIAAALSLNLIFSHLVSAVDFPLYQDLIRSLAFIIVAVVLGWAVDRKNKLQEEALREHERNVDLMREHMAYVERVAHELRNPLQVALGVIDSLETDGLTHEQKALLGLLDRNAGKIGKRLKELTPDG